MSIAVLDCVEHQEVSVILAYVSSAAGHVSGADSAGPASPRWIDEEDDGVAVRSYD